MILSIIIPVYNEIETLETILEAVRAVDIGMEREIILVDDGSSDNCTERENLKFYFNGDPNMTSYCVNCDTFEARGADDKILIDVEVWVEDEEGNTDYCITTPARLFHHHHRLRFPYPVNNLLLRNIETKSQGDFFLR